MTLPRTFRIRAWPRPYRRERGFRPTPPGRGQARVRLARETVTAARRRGHGEAPVVIRPRDARGIGTGRIARHRGRERSARELARALLRPRLRVRHHAGD